MIVGERHIPDDRVPGVLRLVAAGFRAASGESMEAKLIDAAADEIERLRACLEDTQRTEVPSSDFKQCCEACRRFMVVRNSRGQLICEGCLHEAR